MHVPARSAAGCFFVASLFAAAPLSAQTLAHWNFDSGVAGTPFSSIPAADLSGNDNLMNGFDETLGPGYSTETASGTGLSCRVVKQDGFTSTPAMNTWSPAKWTIEISVKLDRIDGWSTIIGRDGTSRPDLSPKSDFYFQKEQDNNNFRLDFSTEDGSRYVLDSGFPAVAGTWYHIALVSNGSTVEMYVDSRDGAGYKLASSTRLSTKPGANNALASTGDIWTFGRGWYGDKQVDHIAGNIDDVRFTNGALPPSQFLHAAPSVAAKEAITFDVARSGQDVSLAWTLPAGAIRQVDLYRHERSEPAGRMPVATITSRAEVYLERVPSKTATYWYWLVITKSDGKTESIGPVSTKSSEVWVP